MAKNYVQEGAYLTLIAPAGGVASGGVYKIGSLAVVAMTDAAEGESFEGATGEVWRLPKLPADVLAAGDLAKLKAGVIDKTGATSVGVVTRPAAANETVCYVKLVQGLA